MCPHTITKGLASLHDEQYWLDATMELMLRCDIVVAHDNWKQSKGAQAERELCTLLRSFGLIAERTAPMQAAGQFAWGDVSVSSSDRRVAAKLSDLHIEVKRQERLQIPAWCRQAEEAGRDMLPVVVFRSSGEPWRVVQRLDDWLAWGGVIA